MTPPTALVDAINLRLALLGLPQAGAVETATAELVSPLLARSEELSRRLSYRLSPADERIEAFLDDYLADASVQPKLPRRTLILDAPGVARELSLPVDGDVFRSDLISSYRLVNGVLHNPANDRRTTAGVFHVAEGGLPIADDKKAVPVEAFARLLDLALEPPQESMILPFSANQPEPAACFVSLLLRPLVVPGVAGHTNERRMEIRFIAPGGLVSNLDFVEGIFGNAGDPYLPENDAALNPRGWTGHTGCVILAPHLVKVRKVDVGLPHIDDATDRQRRDDMCWEDENELYNDGKAFKICARDARGVIVTVIADNYFGYCKKEVKTQISYAANLGGLAEEEHSGGALVFPSYDEGREFYDKYAREDYRLADVLARDPHRFELQPEGHALDRTDERIVLVPEHARYSLAEGRVWWTTDAKEHSIPLRADRRYIGPHGFMVHMARIQSSEDQWTLIGTSAAATNCHKPSTVSGGGKSEISKAISDAILTGNAYASDFDADMKAVGDILARDFSGRFADQERNGVDHRPILSDRRSMGSVVKLLTPSPDYNDFYNAWLNQIPIHVKELVYVVKRSYRPEWGDDWRSHFSVRLINGRKGNVLRLDDERVTVHMLRVGFHPDGSWRLFSLRPDYSPAVKIQTEDDITASVVVPGAGDNGTPALSRKHSENCENLLFQRPDDAIIRGYDEQAEADIATPGTFLSNFEPLDADAARALRDDAVGFSAFTEPMQNLIDQAANNGSNPSWFVCSSEPRLVDGKRSKNPRYLQTRPDLADPLPSRLADLMLKLRNRIPTAELFPKSVDIVAAGRRNNPPEPGVPPLCGFNPLHWMDLPELFIEFISSMTGKSPSTTGAGSEGALTKNPFNALPTAVDLNAALLSFILTGYDGWITAAGWIGPKVRIDHDFSLLVPEVFSRMTAAERDARKLADNGFLEKLKDFEFEGQTVLASRLGYRMTERFASIYFGRIFMHPEVVFTPEMLRPELQDMAVFAESMATMVQTHERVAKAYFEDGTIELASPPLRALLEIMAFGATADGHGLDAPEVRDLFERETVLASDWYAERLDSQHAEAVRLAEQGVAALRSFISEPDNATVVRRLGLELRLADMEAERDRVAEPGYRQELVGTLGRQPF
ncbi:hypothetical protein AADG42_12305 [Ammonicoccus fulvus]|uniref:PPi-type phosphoenolpyruvate carboxykinase lobe 2 domain-containing protein n=1 Tax=Ammonicoccus fulvus TaxID=3138240 RepID=A0ABZ3FTL6_9ACTN